MAFYLLLFNILYFINTKENTACDDTLMTLEHKSLADCKIYTVEEDKNCCVGVISIMGKNNYFCQSFSKSATKDDISSEMDVKAREMEDKFLGAVIKAKASCTEDITPFEGTNCNIYDSQNSEDFGNCTDFKKDNKSDFCCLFTGNVIFDNSKTKVNFCYEVNKEQTSDMEDIAKGTETRLRMTDIQHISCSPDIPKPQEKNNCQFIRIIRNVFLLMPLIVL